MTERNLCNKEDKTNAEIVNYVKFTMKAEVLVRRGEVAEWSIATVC